VAVDPVDFRKGIDGLAGICRKLLTDPFSGHIFVFRNRTCTAIKILVYDGQGFWLCQKRLSKGRFKWWPQKNNSQNLQLNQLAAYELQLLIANGNPSECNVPPDWRKIPN
ncbi:transposase IS66, partial [Candidatus Magnetomorum sp. HK-1]